MNAALKRMYSLKRLMSDNVVKIFLSSFVSSIIDYGICIWCIQSDKEISRLQNKINRFVFTFFLRRNKKLQKNEIISQYFIKLDLLTIAERRKYMLILFVYKFYNSIIKNWYTVSSRGSVSRPVLQVEQATTESYKNSIKWCSTHEWNLLLNNRSIDFGDENFNMKKIVKDYLLRMRINIYLYN